MPTEYFERRERALLGDRFDALYAAPQETAARGVTVSALRAAPEQFAAQADFPVEPSPFCKAGFVVQDPAFKPGRHPYHHAGVFYSQEPSASSAAPLLGVRPGMRVLDSLRVREVTRRRGVGQYLLEEVLRNNPGVSCWWMADAGVEDRGVMTAFMQALGFTAQQGGWEKR